jgi:hypothetical protein
MWETELLSPSAGRLSTGWSSAYANPSRRPARLEAAANEKIPRAIDAVCSLARAS